MKTVLDRYNALKFQEKQLKKELETLRKVILSEIEPGIVDGYEVEVKEVTSKVLDSDKVKELLGAEIANYQKERVSVRLSVTAVPQGTQNGLELMSEKKEA